MSGPRLKTITVRVPGGFIDVVVPARPSSGKPGKGKAKPKRREARG
jgi:hypothetical protein